MIFTKIRKTDRVTLAIVIVQVLSVYDFFVFTTILY